MSKQKSTKPGYGKILDAWIPPEDAGQPVGCVVTSFTFSPVLFEEECLGRFLQLETDPKDDGALYLVEREEKMRQLMCAAALVDQHHARGVRSLRWDLLPARLVRGQGILHAKISLLLWSNRARLIIGSANLTEDGYRRNHEVFGVLDYFADSDAPLAVLRETIQFLRDAVGYATPAIGAASPTVGRWNGFLDRVSELSRQWGRDELPRNLSKPRVFTLLTGPNRPDVFAAIREQCPAAIPSELACVASPFFDPPEQVPNRPASELWTLLKQRGEAIVEFDVTAEEVSGENAFFLKAPESLKWANPANRASAETVFKRLRQEDNRPLHLKSLWLQNDRVVLLLIGSSNFTSAGLGIGRAQNLEANLVYVASRQDGDAVGAFEQAWLPVEEFPIGFVQKFKPRLDESEDVPAPGLVPLPSEFGEATFGCDEQQERSIEFTFLGAPPEGWALFAEDGQEAFVTETAWQSQGSPSLLRLCWSSPRAPSGFAVTWSGATGWAWWPVNVQSAAALPPPPELKDLPLESLIEILTSAKPLSGVLKSPRGPKVGPTSGNNPLDPHKRVDTSKFLLQRTRRVSDALYGLRQRLEKPVVSQQALDWRLRGPVGVMALAEAIERETQQGERAFLLAELCLELARVKPQVGSGSFSASRLRAALREIAAEIRTKIQADALSPQLQAYVKAAFEEFAK
ncbi:MAG: hypothetical protein KJ000_28645 [Pirellulaceae bacterium]|nr:hypothetical protein [Pirellulaceae bacterium]